MNRFGYLLQPYRSLSRRHSGFVGRSNPELDETTRGRHLNDLDLSRVVSPWKSDHNVTEPVGFDDRLRIGDHYRCPPRAAPLRDNTARPHVRNKSTSFRLCGFDFQVTLLHLYANEECFVRIRPMGPRSLSLCAFDDCPPCGPSKPALVALRNLPLRPFEACPCGPPKPVLMRLPCLSLWFELSMQVARKEIVRQVVISRLLLL